MALVGSKRVPGLEFFKKKGKNEWNAVLVDEHGTHIYHPCAEVDTKGDPREEKFRYCSAQLQPVFLTETTQTHRHGSLHSDSRFTPSSWKKLPEGWKAAFIDVLSPLLDHVDPNNPRVFGLVLTKRMLTTEPGRDGLRGHTVASLLHRSVGGDLGQGAMDVVGEGVTEEQARDIILATDAFFYPWGEAHTKDMADFRRKLGIDNTRSRKKDSIGETGKRPRKSRKPKFKTLDLEFICNDVVHCSPLVPTVSAWCWPNGRIRCHGAFCGKGTTLEDIALEWLLVAQRFPFLKVVVLLRDNYPDDSIEGPAAGSMNPVAALLVDAGEVVLVGPKDIGKLPTFGEGNLAIPGATRQVPVAATSTVGVPESWIKYWEDTYGLAV